MDVGELVNVVVPAVNSGQCPFKHAPTTHDKTNVLPPPSTKNNASKLSDSLDGESLHVADIAITLSDGKTSKAQFTAHHIVPGNEAWPSSDLYKWMDKRPGHVKGDIGYDVNSFTNGIDLPGHTPVSSWTSKSEKWRIDYATAAMEADTKKRQFHDRHPAYSDFVIAALNKMAAKLDGKPGGSPGCGKKGCPGNAAGPPFDPPYNVLGRVQALAGNLAGKLSGTPRQWRVPIMTSRFALIYKTQSMTEDQARDALKTDKFTY